MPCVEVITVSGKDILFIDYSGCKPSEMIDVFDQAKEMLLAQAAGCLLLTNFEHAYITPQFMRHAEKEMTEVSHRIKKNAFIGMSVPQQWILKGFRHFIGKEHYTHFDTRQEAIGYLLNDER